MSRIIKGTLKLRASDLGRTIRNFSRTLPQQKEARGRDGETKRAVSISSIGTRSVELSVLSIGQCVTTNFRRSERASGQFKVSARGRVGGREVGQNGKDDWSGVRREARILSESNYRAGRAVVINQIPRRDDATKTNRPQGNPLVKHACLACIIFGRRARKSASVHEVRTHTHTRPLALSILLHSRGVSFHLTRTILRSCTLFD